MTGFEAVLPNRANAVKKGGSGIPHFNLNHFLNQYFSCGMIIHFYSFHKRSFHHPMVTLLYINKITCRCLVLQYLVSNKSYLLYQCLNLLKRITPNKLCLFSCYFHKLRHISRSSMINTGEFLCKLIFHFANYT